MIDAQPTTEQLQERCNELEIKAEELEAAHIALDWANIPRASENGFPYSIMGRILIYRQEWKSDHE